MRELNTLAESKKSHNAQCKTWQRLAVRRSRLSATDLAAEYGFERHQRVYTCPINFSDNDCPHPSFLEALLGDG